MKYFTNPSIVTALAAVVLTASVAKAGTIHWGNAVGDALYQSDGTSLLDSNFHFELGTFDTSGGWAPSLANAADWLSRWKRLDSASYNSATGFFTGTVTLNSTGIIDGDPNPAGPLSLWQGQAAYIWIQNSTDPLPGSEWALLSNSNWTFPNASDDPRDPALDNFYLSNSGTTAHFGKETADTTLTTGEGLITGAPSGGFALQTATFIPEPSSALLLLAAVATLTGRRSRRAS